MNKRETIKYKGFKIKAYYDENAESPDYWGNDDMFLVYDHRQFCVERKGFDPSDIFERMQEGKKLFSEGNINFKYPNKSNVAYWFFPVYAYIHSGVALSLGRTFNVGAYHNRFDVSFKGFALVQRMKDWSYTEDKAYKRAEALVEEWNTYLCGDVYGYQSKCGSYWGFYGDEGYKYMIEEAKSEIDYHIKKQIKKHGELLKTWIVNKVPLDKRVKCEYV